MQLPNQVQPQQIVNTTDISYTCMKISMRKDNTLWKFSMSFIHRTNSSGKNLVEIFDTHSWALTYLKHYSDVIIGTMAYQITSITIVYSTIYSGADQRKHQSSGSLAFVRGIHRGPVNSPHKWPVTRKMFPFDDVIINWILITPDGIQD